MRPPDPRWGPAMERLNLTKAFCAMCGAREDLHNEAHPFMWGKQYSVPDPEDPVTFKRVVDALLAHDIGILFIDHNTVYLISHNVGDRPYSSLYEAVMQAFSGEQKS